MPIYAYRCGSCGFEQDVLQKLSATPLTTCPACKAESFAKQLTAPGFQLKGGGWYATDFKGGAKSGTAASSNSPETPKADSAPACAGGGCACH